jgi:hypothetical protein
MDSAIDGDGFDGLSPTNRPSEMLANGRERNQPMTRGPLDV